MKAAIIMPVAEQRGGAEVMLLHLLQQGCGVGIEWLVIFLEDGPMVRQVAKLGLVTHVIPAGHLRQIHRFGWTVLQIARLASREKVEMIFGWMGKAHLYGGLAAQIAGVSAAWYQLGIPLDKHWLDRLTTRLPAAGILTCSKAGADAQAQISPKRPLRVVYPAVELERFEPARLPSPLEVKRQLGLPADGPIIGIVGRLQRWKGMHTLVEAMPEILRANPTAHCVVVGGDHALELEYPALLRERVYTLGIENRVTFAGLRNNIPEWMQAMDVVVHASDHEPFGIVIVEAMALGKPVVAGDAAGPTEIITHGIDGLLSPYGDSSALAKAVLRYLSDPEFAHQTGQAARRRAQEFSTQRYAHKFIAAIQEIAPLAFTHLN